MQKIKKHDLQKMPIINVDFGLYTKVCVYL